MVKKSEEKDKILLEQMIEKIRKEDEQVTTNSIQQELHWVLVNN